MNQYILLAHMPKSDTTNATQCEWHIYDEGELKRALTVYRQYEAIYKNVQLRKVGDFMGTEELAVL